MAFDVIQRFEVHDDLVGRANYLIAEMERLEKDVSGFVVEDIIERRMIETFGVALIAESRARSHDLVSHPSRFHDVWRTFVSATCEGERDLGVLERRCYERGRTDQTEAYDRGWAKPSTVEDPRLASNVMSTIPATTEVAVTTLTGLKLSELIALHLEDIRIRDGNDVNVDEARLPLMFIAELLNNPCVADLGSGPITVEANDVS